MNKQRRLLPALVMLHHFMRHNLIKFVRTWLSERFFRDKRYLGNKVRTNLIKFAKRVMRVRNIAGVRGLGGFQLDVVCILQCISLGLSGLDGGGS